MALTDSQFSAEEAVLGSILIDSSITAEALSVVRGEDFQEPKNRRLFEAARALFREGVPVDAVTVIGKVGLDRDQKERERLTGILNSTVTSANWREYAEIMRDEATLTRIQSSALRIMEAHTLKDCREHVAMISSEFNSGHGVKGKSLNDLLIEFSERQSPDHQQKQRHSTGLSRIDHLTKLTGGKLCLIGGLPSDGKTALALQWALNFAKSAPVGVFSLETDDETLTDRFVTHGFGIDYDHIVDQRLTDADWVTFAVKEPEIAKRNLKVFDESRLTADEIAAISTAYGFKAIFIDYGQLIETEREKNATRAELLSRVSLTLKSFALSTDTLVFLLLQLKEPKTYTIKTDMGTITKRKAPTMEDIGETRQFEKDADVIFLLYRPERNGTDDDGNPYIEPLSYDKNRILKVAKNKEGRRGSLTLYFDGLHQTFYPNGQQPDAKRPANRKKGPAGGLGQLKLEEIQETGDDPF